MKLSQHNNSLIKTIAFMTSIVMLSANVTAKYAFAATNLNINIDYSRIDDNGTESKHYQGYNLNSSGTSNDAESSGIRNYQLITGNHNKWMQCKWIHCWYLSGLLNAVGRNPYCCALV